jgi:phosphatidyl-myo-inositol dimannoside synthase
VVKALLLLPGAFTGFGGIEKYNRLLIRAFAELEKTTGLRSVPLVLNDAPEDVDGRYVPPGAEWPRAYGRNRRRFISSALVEAFRTKPEIVLFGHVHFGRLAQFVRGVSRRSRFWFVVYGIEVWKPLPGPIRAGLAMAERVLSISDYSRQEVVKNGSVPAGKIDLLPCALDPVWVKQYAPEPHQPEPPANGGPTILTVARLALSERYKGVDSILRALPTVVRKVPGVRYDVVGDGDDRPRLEALARDLGVEERVRFHGSLWPDQLAERYRRCTVFAMPSSKEGFGIVYLEAALFGKPSIAGRHGGAPEVVEDGVTGTLVDREDIPALEAAIVRLLEDPRCTAEKGSAARTRTRDLYMYEKFFETLVAYFQTGVGHP